MPTAVQQLPLGKQGFVTSEQGIGMMSVGITMGSKDLYGKKAANEADVSALIDRCLSATAREAYTRRGTRAALRGNKALRGPRARPVRSRFSKGKALAKNL